MKPLRLLCITRAYNQTAGGMERLSFELIEELRQLSGLEVDVLSRRGSGRLGAIAFVLFSVPSALWRARHADVVHLGDPVLSLHGWLIKKIFHKPVAVTIHGLDVTFANPLYQLYLKLFGQFDLCLPISQHAEALLKNSNLKTKKSKIITPGVHDRYFDSSISRQQLVDFISRSAHDAVSPTSRVLLTVGRLVKRKGHAWFITHVLPHLPDNTVYLIAGDGPEKEHLQQLAGKNIKVLLLGRIRDEDLKILYNTVDAFVQPNIEIAGDAEGFGLVLLEAALCERPVFASSLEGMSDAIHTSKNGTLLPAQDTSAWITALSQFLAPQPAAREYTLQNFSWKQQAQIFSETLITVARLSDKVPVLR